MAVVPYSPRRPADPLEGVSDSFKLLALGDLYQRGMLSSGMFEPTQREESPSRAMKYMIEGKRNVEDMNIKPGLPELRPSEAETIPGRRIP